MENFVEETNWYVLFVFGGKEKALCDYLNKNVDLLAFTPFLEVLHKKEGKFVSVKKAMFPSYIFVESRLNACDFHNKVKVIKARKSGIVKELSYNDTSIDALSSNERHCLEKLLDQNYVLGKSIGIIENDRVMITEGPLIGYESDIIKIDRHKRKAILNITMMNKEVRVNVSLEIIKKI